MPDGRGFMVVYGVAHFGKSLFWHSSELLFAYFLTEACGFKPVTMSLILGLSLLVNALADVLIGRVLANIIPTTAAAGGLQLLGSLICAAAFCLFGASGLAAPGIRLALAIGTILAFRVSYPFFDIPQNAMLTLTTDDDGGRAKLSSYRYIFGGAANIVVAVAFAPLLQGRLAGVQSIHFAGLSVLLSFFAVGGALGLRLNLRNGFDPKVTGVGARRSPSGIELSDQRVWLLFVMLLAMAASGGVFSKLEPYLQAFSFADGKLECGRSALLVAIATGVSVSQPVWSAVAQRLSLVDTLRLALAIVIGSAAVLCLTTGLRAGALAGAAYGCGSGGVSMCLWAMAAAAATAIPKLGGAAPTFGLVTGIAKVGSAAAILGVGGLLSTNGYHDPAVWNISLRTVMAMIPALGALICALLSYHLVHPSAPRVQTQSAA